MGYISYQIYKAKEIINNAWDTSIIDFMEPPIYQMYPENQEFETKKWLELRQPSVFNLQWIWSRLIFTYAQRLLHMANSDERSLRIKAINHLGNIKTLDDWHYSILTHMYDARTAVGLARVKNVDLRFFAEPPFRYLMYNHEMFTNRMKEFLVALHAKSKHVCLEYFINEAFEEVHVRAIIFECQRQ